MTVKLRSSGWELGGEHLPWIWGHIAYWDIERSAWRDVLRSIHQAGHAVISTSVLPRIQQSAPGQYTFGSSRPQTDLLAFLNEVQEAGLKAVIWVGPRSIPGAAAAGYPDDLLKDEYALARDHQGNLIPSTPGPTGEVFCLPSLISDQFVRALEPFARQLALELAPWVHPDGPVIGIGLTLAPGWQGALAPFAADYHFEAVKFYRDFLKRQYKQIAALNRVYGTSFKTFLEADPPRELPADQNLPATRYVDWAKFREDYFVRAAETLHGLFAPIGLDRIPIFLASLPTMAYPANVMELGRTRCFDFIMPDLPLQGLTLDEQYRLLAHRGYETGFLADFGAEPRLGDYVALRGIAAGIRAWDAPTPCGAGTQAGFLADRSGRPVRPHQPIWETLLELSRAEGLMASRIAGDILLLTDPQKERARYLQMPPVSRLDLAGLPSPLVSGSLDPVTAEYVAAFQRLEQFLLQNQFSFFILDGSTPIERLKRAGFILIPGTNDLAPAQQAVIAQLVNLGTIVFWVGDLPEPTDQTGHISLADLATAKVKKTGTKSKNAPKTGRLIHIPEFSETHLLRMLQQSGVQRPLTFDDQGLEITIHRFRSRIFVAVVNPHMQSIETMARREGKFVLKDFWNAGKFLGGNNEIKITLPGRSVKFWELIPC